MMSEMMMVLQGIGATELLAIGTAHLIQEAEIVVNKRAGGDPQAEKARLHAAIAACKEQIAAIIHSTSEKQGEILSTHLVFLEDPVFHEEADALITSTSCSAESAVMQQAESLSASFLAIDDEYWRSRAADIQDIAKRLVCCLQGRGQTAAVKNLPPNSIIVSSDLSPSQTAQINTTYVTGIVTRIGSTTSHTSIMARSLHIAAVVGCSDVLDQVHDGDMLIVDAEHGKVFVHPDEQTLSAYRQRIEAQKDNLLIAEEKKHSKLYRAGHRPVRVSANIGSIQEALTAKKGGADGIGLLRTEFLFSEHKQMPDEEMQFQFYKSIAEIFDKAEPVIIRTMDIGGDKPLPYFTLPKEANPFLGARGIRLCLQHPAMFKTQLRAILRASAFGNLQIMFPMISCMQELTQAKAILQECEEELKQAGIPFNNAIMVGIMVEVPAVAVMAHTFAGQVDFFSIGTNDLIQYTLAADRGNPEVSGLYNPEHPAILALIKRTADAAHERGIYCGICGEMASDIKMIPFLSDCGLDGFSVGAGKIAQTKYALLKQPDIDELGAQ